jgi:hypothetical protein
MTVKAADAHAHVQRLVFVAKMATVLECVLLKICVLLCVFFCGQEDSMQRIFIKKCFLFTVGSVCSVKQFSHGGKHLGDDEEVETEAPEWLRQ